MDTGQRISEIQKRLAGPGGYDFYQSMQKAVRLHVSGHPERARSALDAPANATERRYNSDAFNGFLSKFGSSRNTEPINHKRTLSFRDAGISITVDPLFELMKRQSRNAFALWATQTPPMTQRYGAVACYIMRQAYSNDPLGNATFFFCDLVSGKTYSERQINNNTSLILSADVTSIGTLVREL